MITRLRVLLLLLLIVTCSVIVMFMLGVLVMPLRLSMGCMLTIVTTLVVYLLRVRLLVLVFLALLLVLPELVLVSLDRVRRRLNKVRLLRLLLPRRLAFRLRRRLPLLRRLCRCVIKQEGMTRFVWLRRRCGDIAGVGALTRGTGSDFRQRHSR